MPRIEASEVIEGMVDVNRFGALVWRDDSMSVVPGGDNDDTRVYPEKYIAMTGAPRYWDTGDSSKFHAKNLTQNNDGTFSSPDGVITGALGLLQLTEKFKIKPSNPKNVLLIGAITDKSLMCTLEWIKCNGWLANVTLVDSSSIPLSHIKALDESGYFKESPEFSLARSNILSFEPVAKPSVIIGDILNLWSIPQYALNGKDVYRGFGNILEWVGNNMAKRGVFYSRCVVYPDGQPNIDLNINSGKDNSVTARTRVVGYQLGSLVDSIDYSWLEESLSSLFENSYPASYCGLSGQYSAFTEHPTLEGVSAEKMMRRLHHKHFSEVEEIKVIDLKSRATYLNFACRN